MNIVTVRINGVEYNLKGNEKEEYLHKVASYVDKKVKNIMDNNSKLSTSSTAILTAINAVDDMLKKEEEIQQLLDKIKNMEEKEKDFISELEKLNNRINELEGYNEVLKSNTQANKFEEALKEKEIEVETVKKERDMLQQTCKEHLEENNILKSKCKEFKFQVQSSKYKIMDLQHKLIETQVQLVKEKKRNNPMLNFETIEKKS
ncbi:Cell division protein ZapA [Clostridium liquoris]|jgi:cell division protein ZapA|uniref:Cell division protein ZapA n=1 Tax=Clostridium liquoris TaxID=1289519 RepID=A0A2T0B001_9CLOT|nr:cell division protein ZapA [Clostridium liquoris]PRR76831.1 Cell division protein ZapA [Clostridium liquoris]